MSTIDPTPRRRPAARSRHRLLVAGATVVASALAACRGLVRSPGIDDDGSAPAVVATLEATRTVWTTDADAPLERGKNLVWTPDPDRDGARESLRRRVEFAVPLHRTDPTVGVVDGQGGIEWFGFDSSASASEPRDATIRQLRTHGDPYHPYDRTLVVEGETANGERLVLACVPAARTLEEAWGFARAELDTPSALPYGVWVPRPDFALDGPGIPAGGPDDDPVRRRVELRVATRTVLPERTTLDARRERQWPRSEEYMFGFPFLLALLPPRSTDPTLLVWFGNDALFARHTVERKGAPQAPAARGAR